MTNLNSNTTSFHNNIDLNPVKSAFDDSQTCLLYTSDAADE